MESMMTARQVAELLGVHENWVYDQAVAGDLPSYKLGGSRRFDPEELRGWIVAHREIERAGPRSRPARTASRATEANSSVSRLDRRAVEPERPKLRNSGRSEANLSDSGDAQARLFEA